MSLTFKHKGPLGHNQNIREEAMPEMGIAASLFCVSIHRILMLKEAII
ncbi:MAG: hypothetical protein IBX70_11490 [Clostridia bacterium]|nr:hypothetical protein [Clostridia bacterium]